MVGKSVLVRFLSVSLCLSLSLHRRRLLQSYFFGLYRYKVKTRGASQLIGQ